MTARKRLTTKQRVSVFKDHGGICHMCHQPIQIGIEWEVSHDIPLELGGADDATNWKPAHKTCHREHTALVDAPTIAKAKRVEAKHIGAAAPASKLIRSAPFPVSKGRKEHPMRLPPRRVMFVGVER